MSEKEKQIIQTITDVLPKLSPEDKAYLLGFGEGLAASVKPSAEVIGQPMRFGLDSINAEN